MKKRFTIAMSLVICIMLTVSGMTVNGASNEGVALTGASDLTFRMDKEAVEIFAPVRDAGDEGDHVHGSSVVELPNGELLAVWFQGNGERDATTTRIMGARSANRGKTWMEPFVMADSQGIADINPALYVDKGDRLWLFWYPVLAGRWETSQPKYAYAEKGSYEFSKVGNNRPEWTWSEVINVKLGMNIGETVNPDRPEDYISPILQKSYVKTLSEKMDEFERYNFLPARDGGAGMNRRIYGELLEEFAGNQMKLAGGDPTDYLYAPTMADRIWEQRSGYPLARRLGWQTKDKPLSIDLEGGKVRMLLPLYSDTMGHSMMAITEYDPLEPLDDNSVKWTFSEPIVGAAGIQASVAQRKDGTLIALMRDNGPIPKRVVSSESKDGGFTWTIAKDIPELLDPGVGHDLLKLKNGNWVFVHVDALTGRNSLTAALSDDEGRTWKYRRHIAFDIRANPGSYHYPAVAEASNGDILISFTRDYSAADVDSSGGSLGGFNNIMFARVTEDWVKKGDEGDKKEKVVYEFDSLEKEIPVASNFDINTASDQAIKALLPSKIKGYLTYGKGAVNQTMNYIELPVNWDLSAVKANFRINRYIDGKIFGEIDTTRLPKDLAQITLPEFKPQLRALFYTSDATVVQLREVTVSTEKKTPPVLPQFVTAVLSDGEETEVEVTWDVVSPSDYAKSGHFMVEGRAANTDLKAVAQITVIDLKHDGDDE